MVVDDAVQKVPIPSHDPVVANTLASLRSAPDRLLEPPKTLKTPEDNMKAGDVETSRDRSAGEAMNTSGDERQEEEKSNAKESDDGTPDEEGLENKIDNPPVSKGTKDQKEKQPTRWSERIRNPPKPILPPSPPPRLPKKLINSTPSEDDMNVEDGDKSQDQSAGEVMKKPILPPSPPPQPPKKPKRAKRKRTNSAQQVSSDGAGSNMNVEDGDESQDQSVGEAMKKPILPSSPPPRPPKKPKKAKGKRTNSAQQALSEGAGSKAQTSDRQISAPKSSRSALGSSKEYPIEIDIDTYCLFEPKLSVCHRNSLLGDIL